jgi:hypothetical protein
MVKKYVFVRIPVETYARYKHIKTNVELDLKKYSGKTIKVPMTKVFKMVASPEFNENYIQLDLGKVSKFMRGKK